MLFVVNNMDELLKKQLEEGLELRVQFEKRGGLVPAIVQDYSSGEVLMLGYVNQEALDETLRSGYATFYSTSKKGLWKKGETSGDFLRILEIRTDCDQDALLYKVERVGKGACHTKDSSGETRTSCFYRKAASEGKLELA